MYILQGNLFLYIFKKLTVTVFFASKEWHKPYMWGNIFISECHRGPKKKKRQNEMKYLVSVYFSSLLKFKIQSKCIHVYKRI